MRSLLLIVVAMIAFAAGDETPDEEFDAQEGSAEGESDYSRSCDSAFHSCHDQHLSVASLTGREVEASDRDNSYLRALQETPVEVQCQHRADMNDCIASDGRCSGESTGIKRHFEVIFEFFCQNNYEDMETYWKCLMEIHLDSSTSDCYMQVVYGDSNSCSVDQYSQCFNRVADRVGNSENSTECRGRVDLEGVKSLEHRFVQELKDNNVMCRSRMEKRSMFF